MLLLYKTTQNADIQKVLNDSGMGNMLLHHTRNICLPVYLQLKKTNDVYPLFKSPTIRRYSKYMKSQRVPVQYHIPIDCFPNVTDVRRVCTYVSDI